VDHFAFTVPRLDEAVDFFISVLGAELAYREGPIADPEGEWMSRHLGVDKDAVAHLAMLRLGPTSNLELFEYQACRQRTTPPRLVDDGGHYLAFRVDDIEKAAAYLRQWNVEVLGDVQAAATDAPDVGSRWVYFRAPWGMFLKLQQLPAEMPYQNDTPGRLFGPCASWRTDREVTGGIPTARNIDHVGYTVADLDAATDFFVEVVGAELLYREGPVRLPASFMHHQLAAPTAVATRAVLRLGPTDNLQLFQYDAPSTATRRPRNSDIGGHHLAFRVDDVDRATAYLRGQPGVEVLDEPQTVVTGPIAGDRWVYFVSPFGLAMEVLNLPDGSLPYEQHTRVRRRGGDHRGWDNRAVGRPEIRPSAGAA
jgi:catechol 2,3-dioxygenase-like lactoylglutathione lyase family enzyme